jgi:hypothetical protein
LKHEKPEQMITNTKGILWNPALQRKNLESMKQKQSDLEFLSNNLNWAYATVLMIGSLILCFIIKNFFSAVPKALSAMAMNMPAIFQNVNADANHDLTGNHMKSLLDTSSQIFYFISQNVLMTSLLLGLIIYLCLLAFHAVQSIKIGKSFGRKFIDTLTITNKHFLDIAAFPFVILEKAILYPIATVSAVARLIFTKRS